VQVHEKRKHSPKNENLSKEVKNNHINYKEIKIEDVPILCIKKPIIRNHMISVLQNKSIRNDLHQRVQLKKMDDLLQKKESPSLLMKRKQNRIIIQDCYSSLSKIIKELKKIEPPRRSVGNWITNLIRENM
jgi:hypothetical protein